MFVLYLFNCFLVKAFLPHKTKPVRALLRAVHPSLNHDLYSDFHLQVLEDREVLDHSKEFVVQVRLW